MIGRCLDAFLRDAEPGEFDVTVVANGCTDATADVARARPGVRVVEKAYGLKTDGLNAGDAVADRLPAHLPRRRRRDIADGPTGVGRGLSIRRCGASGRAPLAVVPRRALDLRDGRLAVRAFYAINGRLPLYRHGSGQPLRHRAVRAGTAPVRHLPRRHRRRPVPRLALRRLRRSGRSTRRPCASPRRTRTRGLVDRLARVRRGNAELRRARAVDAARCRPAARFAWVSRGGAAPARGSRRPVSATSALILAAELTSRRHVRRGVTGDAMTRPGQAA